MDFLNISPEAGLAGLFASAFISATLMPGGSEALLFALLRLHPEQAMHALVLATLGNTLGGMTSYGMARWLPQKGLEKMSPRAMKWVQHWGSYALLASWAPLIGDLLCVAAGWLRLNWAACMLWMAVGKGARYALVAAGAAAF
ncbi:MAG TPA: YqaA family protein [Rhodocyclaceae bacterium]